MKRSRFTEEQIIGILKEQEAGAKTADHDFKSTFVNNIRTILRDAATACVSKSLMACTRR